MVLDELARLQLSRDDISAIVAVSADAVRRNLVSQGLTSIEEKWTAYANLPRKFTRAASRGCVRGDVVLSAVAALEPSVLMDFVDLMASLRVNVADV